MSDAGWAFAFAGWFFAVVLTLVTCAILSQSDADRSERRALVVAWSIWAVALGPFWLRSWLEALLS